MRCRPPTSQVSARTRRHVVVVVAEQAGAVVAQPEIERDVRRDAPLVLGVEAEIVVADVEIQGTVRVGREEEEARGFVLETEALEQVLVARDGVGEQEVAGVLDVVGHFFEPRQGSVQEFPSGLERMIAGHAAPRLVEREAVDVALGAAAGKLRSGLDETGQEEQQHRLGALGLVEVDPGLALEVARARLQDRVRREHGGLEQGAPERLLLLQPGGAGKNQSARDAGRDLAVGVVVGVVAGECPALRRGRQQVDLAEECRAIEGGTGREVFGSLGGGEAGLDPVGHGREVDVAAALLVDDLAGGEEERAIALDRSSQREPVLVARELRRVLAGHVGGVEAVVAIEVERAPLEGVGSRARDHVDDSALGAPELGLIAGGDDLELLDRVLGVALERAAVERVVVVGAVVDVGGRRRTLAEDGEALVPHRVGTLRDTRHQRHQVLGVARLERQGVDGDFLDPGGDLAALDLDQRPRADHVELLGHRLDLELGVDGHGLVDAGSQLVDGVDREVIARERDGVGSGWKRRQPVGAVGTGGGAQALALERLAARGHGDGGERCAVGIGDPAGETGGDLGLRSGGRDAEREKRPDDNGLKTRAPHRAPPIPKVS